jgi:hypothetical protein
MVIMEGMSKISHDFSLLDKYRMDQRVVELIIRTRIRTRG